MAFYRPHFVAFDTNGALSFRSPQFIDYCAKPISFQSARQLNHAKGQISKRLIYVIWSNISTALFACTPCQGGGIPRPD